MERNKEFQVAFACPTGYLKFFQTIVDYLPIRAAFRITPAANPTNKADILWINKNQDEAVSRRQYTCYGKASQRCTGFVNSLDLLRKYSSHRINQSCNQICP